MRPMVPLGFEPHFSTGEIVLIATVVVAFGVFSALPATATLAAVGYRRGIRHPGWNAFWYWLWGTALALAGVVGILFVHPSWWSVPLSWPLPLLLAWILNPKVRRPRSELGWTDTRPSQQGER